MKRDKLNSIRRGTIAIKKEELAKQIVDLYPDEFPNGIFEIPVSKDEYQAKYMALLEEENIRLKAEIDTLRMDYNLLLNKLLAKL